MAIGKILVVDDEKVIRDLFHMVLGKAGYEVVTAGNREETLGIFKKGMFNLVAMDIRLPGTDGVELLAKLKNMDPEIEGIIITGYASLDSAIEALREGVSDYITKPLGQMEDLIRIVNRLVEKQKLAIENKRLQEEVKRQRDELKKRVLELETLYHISKALSYTLDYQELLKLIVISLAKVVDYDACASFFLTDKGGDLTIRAADIVTEEFINEVKQNLMGEMSSLAHREIGNEISITLGVISKQDKERESCERVKSSLSAPLIVENKVVGIVTISSGKENAFTSIDARIFFTIANQLAAAIKGLQTVLTEERNTMRAMVDSMIEGVIMIDEHNEILVLNPQAKKMLGFELKEEVTGIMFDEKMNALGLDRSIKECRSKESLVIKEITFSEEKAVVHCELVPVRNIKDKVRGVVIILRDITKEKEVEKMKTEFVSNVSHELRTPLTTIKESVSQVLDGILGETTKEQREFLSICLEDIERLKRTVDALLDISKIETGKMQIKRELIDIVELAKGVVRAFYVQVEKKGLEVKTNFSEETIEMYADKDKIVQVFTNLLANAMRFTQQGYIEISVLDKGGYVECSVSDTGEGIAEEDTSRVFDKFRQFRRVVGPGEKGTGLGLSIAKGIIDLHRGRIWAESASHKGSRFIFTLPKCGREEILSGRIKRKTEKIKKEQKEFSVFVIRFDDYPDLEKKCGREKARETLLQILQKIKNNVRLEEIIDLNAKKEIILLVKVSVEDIYRMNAMLKKIIKNAILKTEKENEINFSYGYAVYPLDGNNIKELLNKARKSLRSEKQERIKKKIMAVDDDPVVIEVLKKLLEKVGYNNFVGTYDGIDALQKIKNEIPDLLILDIKMPKMSGYEVIERLKERRETKDISILIMSGYKVEREKLKRYISEGGMPIISKPVNTGQLKRFVDYLM